MAGPSEQTDFFFIVEREQAYANSAEIWARGNGEEVLPVLARMAILHAAVKDARFQHSGSWMIFDEVESHLTGDAFKPQLIADPLVLSTLMTGQRKPHVSHPAYEKYRQAALEQVGEGVRSPQDVAEDIIQLRRDRNLLRRLSRYWFDYEGRQLIRPTSRGADLEEQVRPQLALDRVTRNAAAHFISPEDKTRLFEAVPDKAKAYSLNTVEFRKDRHGRIDLQAPFVGKVMLLHKVFGFIEPNSSDFVPVFTRPATD